MPQLAGQLSFPLVQLQIPPGDILKYLCTRHWTPNPWHHKYSCFSKNNVITMPPFMYFSVHQCGGLTDIRMFFLLLYSSVFFINTLLICILASRFPGLFSKVLCSILHLGKKTPLLLFSLFSFLYSFHNYPSLHLSLTIHDSFLHLSSFTLIASKLPKNIPFISPSI